ncbi:MAG: NADH:ubiquinone reductase (Na(+)-transporting) subunit A, partial [Flavobacteriaceae bacterium]
MEIIKKIQNRRGAQLHIKGGAEKILKIIPPITRFALKPDDFFGTTPKLIKKEGEKVQAGEAVFYSKNNPQIQFVSPTSGTIETIQRGARRKIEKII